ncbi:hypothetical protein E0198_004615 [Clavispora lusitaniae]|nr:hypothetical protein E0198_004615 [Clavispora lusitaniae]
MPSNSQADSIDTAGFITVGRKQKNSTAENEERVSVKLFDFSQSFARIAVNANVFSVIGFGEESSKEEDEKYENSEVDDVEEDSSAPEQPESEYFEDDKTLEQILDEMEWEIERDIERVTTITPEIPVESTNLAIILWRPTYNPTIIQAGPCRKPKTVRFAEKVEIFEIEEKYEDLKTEDTEEKNGNEDTKEVIVKSHKPEEKMRKDACQLRMAYESKKLEFEVMKMNFQMKRMDYKRKKMDFKMKKMDFKMKKMDSKMKKMDYGKEKTGDGMIMRKHQIKNNSSLSSPAKSLPSSRDLNSGFMARPSSKEKKENHNISSQKLVSLSSP